MVASTPECSGTRVRERACISVDSRLLEHELDRLIGSLIAGAGRILRLGSNGLSPQFREGDLVILSAASCESCHYCSTGHPAYCTNHAAVTLHANEPIFVLANDQSKVIGGGYFGQSSFASLAPVKASSAANVTSLVRDAEELKLYAPLGCGIMTGAGAFTHVGNCKPDDVVCVVGLGAVGLAGVCAAKHLGVKTILAADVVQSRVNLAKSFGATHGLLTSPDGIQASGHEKLEAAIVSQTPTNLGCTHILDTTPSVAVLSSCLEALRNNGTLLQVGVKPVGAKLELDLLMHLVHGRKLVGVIEGDRDPKEAIPELVQWCRDGTLPLQKMSTQYDVTEFWSCRKAMEDGSVVKGVLIW